jgi:two-component system, NtrC family, response regulator HydG
MRPRLVIEAGEGEPAVCNLEPDQVASLGRNRKNTLVLHDRHASRWHAEIMREEGRWVLRDRDTMNGTLVNRNRVREPVTLVDGDEIRIGDTRLRFQLDPADLDTDERPALPNPPPTPNAVAAPLSELSRTSLQADELTVLCTFMAGSVEEVSPRELITRALTTVHAQTGASVTGFLSLDQDDPLPKIVLPDLAHVDIHLSRKLTQKVQQEGRLIWVGSREDDALESESLLSFHDAVCVPLQVGDVRLGALHVYKASDKLFSEREVQFCSVLAGYLAHSLHVLRSRRQLEAENLRLRGHLPLADDELIGDSHAMMQLRQHISRLAPRQGTVLIVGESGSGKELVALALHRQSTRRDAPLVTVNCAAIAASMSEGELFGSRKGAFTGAERDRKGYFQQADEGTLFLDEIGDLSLECQAKLLRVIEGKGFLPVGGESEVKPDVRIIAATHRNLERDAREGRFRQDLFFRLGIPIRVPALRDHGEDIPLLVQHFLRMLVPEYRPQVRLTEAAMTRLREYSWPGNVRQLLLVLENAVVMSDGLTIDAHDLHLTSEDANPPSGPASLNLEEVEASTIRHALRQTHGNLSQAAKVLGIHRDTLGLKLKKYEIDKDQP